MIYSFKWLLVLRWEFIEPTSTSWGQRYNKETKEYEEDRKEYDEPKGDFQ